MIDWSGLPVRAVTLRETLLSLRPLKASDETALADYFTGLSAETRRVYAPHPFDRVTAAAICRGLDTAEGRSYLRLITVHESAIAAYFILYLGLHKNDQKRSYADLDPALACALAPSVADAWQNSGLGSRMLDYTQACARQLGRPVMVLWGGVRASNARAIHFYSKAGFRKMGEFLCTVNDTGTPEVIKNYDMLLEL